MKTKPPTNSTARRATVKGKRMVIMNEADYEALLHNASADASPKTPSDATRASRR